MIPVDKLPLVATCGARPRRQASANAEGFEAVTTLNGHTDHVFALAVSPDRDLLASGPFNRKVKIWKLSGREGVGREGVSLVQRFAGFRGAASAKWGWLEFPGCRLRGALGFDVELGSASWMRPASVGFGRSAALFFENVQTVKMAVIRTRRFATDKRKSEAILALRVPVSVQQHTRTTGDHRSKFTFPINPGCCRRILFQAGARAAARGFPSAVSRCVLSWKGVQQSMCKRSSSSRRSPSWSARRSSSTPAVGSLGLRPGGATLKSGRRAGRSRPEVADQAAWSVEVGKIDADIKQDLSTPGSAGSRDAEARRGQSLPPKDSQADAQGPRSTRLMTKGLEKPTPSAGQRSTARRRPLSRDDARPARRFLYETHKTELKSKDQPCSVFKRAGLWKRPTPASSAMRNKKEQASRDLRGPARMHRAARSARLERYPEKRRRPLDLDDSQVARCTELANEINQRLALEEKTQAVYAQYGYSNPLPKVEDVKPTAEVLQAATKALAEDEAGDRVVEKIG